MPETLCDWYRIWHRIADVLDIFYIPFFLFVFFQVFRFWISAALHSRAQEEIQTKKPGWRWRAFLKIFSKKNSTELSNAEIRAAGPQHVRMHRILIVLVAIAIAYPFLSPTFCQKHKCNFFIYYWEFSWPDELRSECRI